MTNDKTVNELLKEKKHPVVAIDEKGIFFFVNDAFEKEYGWTNTDLQGQVITKIMPSHMRDAHNFGFSRFLVTEAPRILGKKLPLPVFCKNESIKDAELYIIGDKTKNSKWRFAATLKPRTS
ncbi:MAG: PAS domain S-box protein [bacterium]|nr:PAS domain S-box protein [bacterium]